VDKARDEAGIAWFPASAINLDPCGSRGILWLMVTEERVVNLEEAVAGLVEQTKLILAAIREDIAEMRLSNARTDRQLLELRQDAEKDREEARKLREQDREEARKLREQDREEAKRERREFNKKLAEISDSMGTLIEDMVAPCGFQLARTIFATEEAIKCGIRLRARHPEKRGEMREIDLLALGPTKALVVEAKRRMDAAQAAEYRQRVQELPEFFPELQGKTIYPAVASVYLEPSLVAFLNHQRMYGIAMGEEVMEVVNLGQF
jgi:hypothetical protein